MSKIENTDVVMFDMGAAPHYDHDLALGRKTGQ